MFDFFLYLIENRSITRPLMGWPVIDQLVLLLSPIIAVTLFCVALIIIKKYKNWGVFPELVIFSFAYVIANLIAGGNTRRCLGLIYPSIGLQLMAIICLNNRVRLQYFIKITSWFYFIMEIIDLASIFSPFGYTEQGDELYFLGGENHIGYPLLLGLMYNYLDYLYNKSNYKLTAYIVLQTLTIFIVFSGSNVVGLFVCFIMLIPQTRYLLSKISLHSLTIIYFVVYFITIFFYIDFMLESPSFSNFLEKTLGKDPTLSGRTDIWLIVLYEIAKFPIWGHGVLEDTTEFVVPAPWRSIGWKMDSAHNQLLQTIYESGLLSIIALSLIIFKFSRLLNKSNLLQKQLFISITLGVLVMYLAEAPSLSYLLEVLILGSVICKIEPKMISKHKL